MHRVNPLALLVAGCFFMEFLDGTIITPALPQMAVSLGTDPVELHVGISAYLLSVAVMILPGGWAAERFGPRVVFTSAICVFTAASALCAMAGSANAFVLARVLQGVGGAMMVPVGRLVVLRATEKADLMRAIALLTWPGLTAPLFGPPLGGFIAQHLDWRFIFLINLPLGAVALLLALWMVPSVRAGTRRRFDLLGFALAGSACLCAELALDKLGGPHPPWLLAVLLAAGAIATGFAARWHLLHTTTPLIDPSPWRVATFRMVMIAGTFMRGLIASMPFLLPLLFQLGFGYDPTTAGLLTLGLFAGNIGIKPLTSSILRRWGFRTVIIGNALLQAATMLGFACLGMGTPMLLVLPLLVISGSSRSTQFTALGTLVFAEVPQDRMAPANTWYSVAFQFGNGMGVAVGALLLRLAGTIAGGGPDLLAFRGTFVALAALMTVLAATGLILRREAGASVSGHRTSIAKPA